MSRTAVQVTTLTAETVVADPAGTALDATNGHSIMAAGIPIEQIALRIVNTTASQKAATVKSGDSPPASEAGSGDVTVTCAAASVATYYLTQAVDAASIDITTPTVKWVRVLSARHLQDDGTISIDIASGMTGFITAFRIPR